MNNLHIAIVVWLGFGAMMHFMNAGMTLQDNKIPHQGKVIMVYLFFGIVGATLATLLIME